MKRTSSLLQYIIAMAAACLVFAVMQGIRDNYGIMLKGIVSHSGIDYASVSFVIAVGQVLYGATQPLFGMIAIRKSNAFVMMCGILLMGTGLFITPFCKTIPSLLLFFGILLPAGTGALCCSIIMGAIAPVIGESKAVAASGIIQASAGIGDALMSPTLQFLTMKKGITFSMPSFGVLIILMIPIVIWLQQRSKIVAVETNEVKNKDTIFSIVKESMKDSTYWLLLAGFSTCGFHMAIIETHLFSQYTAAGIGGQTASFALTIYGIATMLGAVLTGALSQKYNPKNVLGSVYAIRIFIAIAFLTLPISVPFAFVMTALLGMTGDATVPPTISIITKKVGIAQMTIIYGSIFIGHQIGAFFSAYLGGVLVDTSLGYSALWITDMFLATMAATASYLIKTRGKHE